MSEEAQLAFLQRMREEGLRKRSFLVINDFDSSSLPALLEENGGWLSRDDLRFLGYEINDDSLLQGAQIGTKEYTLRCV